MIVQALIDAGCSNRIWLYRRAFLPIYDEVFPTTAVTRVVRDEQGAVMPPKAIGARPGETALCCRGLWPRCHQRCDWSAGRLARFSIPLCGLTGQVPTFRSGSAAFREGRHVAHRPCTKHNWLVEKRPKNWALSCTSIHVATAGARSGSCRIPKDGALRHAGNTPKNTVDLRPLSAPSRRHDRDSRTGRAIESATPCLFTGGGVSNSGPGGIATAPRIGRGDGLSSLLR